VKRESYILCLFLLIAAGCFSQDDSSPFRPWQLISISGQARARGTYRESETNFGGKETDAYLNGVLQLRTQSYFIHPNFMLVNLSGTYNPETTRSSYIGVPDYSEKTNSQGLDFSALFFRKKNFNLTTSANYNDAIMNVENVTRIRATSKTAGASFNYSNKILPFTVSYSQQTSDQNTIGLNRTFHLDQGVWQATANKSFTTHDNSSFSYVQTNSSSIQNDPVFLSPMHIVNNINVIAFTNALYFDRKKNYTLTSSVTNSDQRGSFLYSRLYGQEYLTVKLPRRFMFYSTYGWGQSEQGLITVRTQDLQSVLSHQLYESLNSRLIFEHRQNDQNFYHEQKDRVGLDLKYVKKIPKGKLNLAYTYYKEFQSVSTPSVVVNVLRDEYVLTDGQITLFRNQFVNIRSVLVKDATGAIIYQPNIDYILIDKSPFMEIVRVPGGMIPNNATVYIDYNALRPGLYQYNSNIHTFYGDVFLFKSVLNAYYRMFVQNFNTTNQVENQVLNAYTRQVVGVRVNFNYAKGGIEYERNQSNLIPYNGLTYFVYFQKMYRKMFFSLSGNWRDMQMTNEDTRREDIDVSFKMAYSIFRNVKVDLDYMYRTMKGRGLNLDVQTAKLEVTANLNKLFFSIGSDYYLSRNYSSYLDYKGTYIQITRSF
jgi:hypothetical protein